MTVRDKQKLVTLCQELIAEAKYKIHQTDRLRDKMSSKLGFQVGMIMGQIREKYKTMLELYRGITNKHTGKSKLILPRVPEMKPVHYIWRMEYISALEIDIDRLVHILEQLDLDELWDSQDHHDTVMKNISRAGGRSEDLDMMLARKEEELKRSYRQEFLRKKLGLPVNTSMDSYPHVDNQ
ncbi:uncharacterized protein [Maniola hyperantus]|uniref:uncharacterized protein n=1 Tax=Aphantopus hyperantus TaxID=2795564 RepID=UPI00156A13CA|nr:uncharacterized protein LOC117995185 [Maniola hyperantus]